MDQAYEPPPKPELVLRAGEQTVDECVHSIVSVLMDDVSTQNIYTYIYITYCTGQGIVSGPVEELAKHFTLKTE